LALIVTRLDEYELTKALNNLEDPGNQVEVSDLSTINFFVVNEYIRAGQTRH
jgi:hypothetical protein